jgi:hypothetical protein
MSAQPYEAYVPPLAPHLNTTREIEPESLLRFYRTLSVQQRASYFSDTGSIAKQHGVQRRTVQRWVDKGWVLAVRISKKYLVYLPSLDSYLSRCQWRRLE